MRLWQGDAPALLVRRKGAGLPEDLGRGSAQAERIDWCRSTLLNLVIQASFALTVATCRHALYLCFTRPCQNVQVFVGGHPFARAMADWFAGDFAFAPKAWSSGYKAGVLFALLPT